MAHEERPQSGWEALTPSEVAVVQAITSGMTNREAAAHLFLSPHTVSTHMRHVFQKLQINSRVQLARIAAEHDGAAAEAGGSVQPVGEGATTRPTEGSSAPSSSAR
jgi:DNA-binding CsgD family transcriptional regulator